MAIVYPNSEAINIRSKSASRNQSRVQWLFAEWWLTELLAVVVSCCLTVALCLILHYFDGQPAPLIVTVFSSGITLNTIVSLLTALSVALALVAVQQCLGQLKWLWYLGNDRSLRDLETYDEANRGLVGAFTLIWKLRATPLASIGAILMISQLAVAPLTQQSISYISTTVNTNDVATLSTALSYGTLNADQGSQTSSSNIPREYTNLGSSMKGAILSGLFADANTVLNSTQPACTSGNCTFPTYQSLAVCWSSADVSEHLTATNSGSETNYCLPGGYCLTTGNTSEFIRANITSAAYPATFNASNSLLNFSSLAFAGHVSPIADVYVIYNGMSDWGIEDQHLLAAEFVLDWCVANFNTLVVNSTAYTSRLTAANLDFNVDSQKDLSAADNNTFSVDYFAHASLQRYLWDLLSGSISEVPDPALSIHYSTSDEATVLANPFLLSSNNTEDTLPTLNSILANTATSMTNYMRSVSGQPTVFGTVEIQESFVQVAWGFLAAPIAFNALTALLFVATLILSTWHRPRGGASALPPKWKSSSIPTLRALDPQLQADLGGLGHLSAMDDEIQKVKVSLVRDGDNWKLVEVKAERAHPELSPLHTGNQASEGSPMLQSGAKSPVVEIIRQDQPLER